MSSENRSNTLSPSRYTTYGTCASASPTGFTSIVADLVSSTRDGLKSIVPGSNTTSESREQKSKSKGQPLSASADSESKYEPTLPSTREDATPERGEVSPVFARDGVGHNGEDEEWVRRDDGVQAAQSSGIL
ncbi:hypothetical protein I302_103228 [Kwoniella bestiolae CBS 10118]|uniref:Uncharacterized protein n=1 Tax=Kwoniella bestiolae CBS 10118 TaxID=1296100 RepID=A0A1B9G7V1_9TREE|nr:hypothetical protein I302_01927 [Kwoniella bestiolae CBS 10118]OCF27092.1 hypothetical protein I302_01927 [Kwoniella bestiolae CBS 10118]